MAVGNFLSALIQRGTQVGAGALRGKQEGQERAAANARQADQDALERSMTESRMETERLNQAALGREAQSYQTPQDRIADQLRLIQARREAAIALEQERAKRPRTTGTRADPRVATIGKEIERVGKDVNNLEQQRVTPFRSVGPGGEMLDERAAADSNAVINRAIQAKSDTTGMLENQRRNLTGLGGLPGMGPAKEKISRDDYDALVDEGYSDEEIAADFDVSDIQ